jgi:hypothetical protein
LALTAVVLLRRFRLLQDVFRRYSDDVFPVRVLLRHIAVAEFPEIAAKILERLAVNWSATHDPL